MTIHTAFYRSFRCVSRPLAGAMSAVFFAYLVLSAALPYSTAAWHVPLAILNGLLFFMLTGLTVWLALRAVDEFQRVLLLRAFGFATLVVMGFVCVWGHVELSAPGTLPHLPLLTLPVAVILLGSAAKVLLFRRHRPLAE